MTKTKNLEHLVLLGDSIFDNGSYTKGEPDVKSHMESMVPDNFKVSLLAKDGSFIMDVKAQLKSLPSDATRLLLSVGGNDILRHRDFLTDTAFSGTDLPDYLSLALVKFEQDYRTLILNIVALKIPLITCTVYNGNLEKSVREKAKAAIAVFNDCIYRVSGENKIPVLELRKICTKETDYANPIEPSGIGGRKIAEGILELLLN